ncbi:MAG TPA: S41 family peptidase, partial [Burkholderiaceae bacterium]|nr:S41 family peptidase [Burkholderiaceae bacterium]
QLYGDVQGTVADEKAWVRQWIDDTYLWYQDVRNLSATTLDANRYATAVAYFGVLKSSQTTASGQPKDKFHFTYDTPTWVALSQSGQSYGYGFEIALLSATVPRQAVVAFTDPSTPAAAASIARGAEILTVDGVDLVNNNTSSGVAALNAGLFPEQAGSHTFTLRDYGSSTARSVTLTAGVITSTPVQNVKTLPAPNNQVGYMLFNDHVATSEQQLINAITQLRTAGVTDLVLDIRYNGGGYLDIASELAYMIAGPTTTTGKAFETLSFNDKNPFQLTDAQRTTPFHSTALGFSATSGQALPYLGLSRVYVLTGAGTCSASEAIVNGLRGVGVTVNLIGATTCGKPYGFFPQDNCNTTYFAIQFQGVNQLGFGDYSDGFAPTCAVSDDFAHALGDPAEARLAMALGHRTSGTCVAASSTSGMAKIQSVRATVDAGEPHLVRSALRENRFYRKSGDQ